MSYINTKKQEELAAQKLKNLLALPENKKCFDCPTKSPFFVNVSIQTFVCTRCSGLVLRNHKILKRQISREVGHRVKSISASKFSGPEILSLQHGGNGIAHRIWLSKYKMANSAEAESDNDVRLFMRQKYFEQKWLDPVLLKEHVERVTELVKTMFTEEGLRRARVSSPPLARSSTDSFNGRGLDIQAIQSPPLKANYPQSPTLMSPPSSGSPLHTNPIQSHPHKPYSIQQGSPVETSSAQSFHRPVVMSPSKSWMDDNLPIGLTPVGQSLRNIQKPLQTSVQDLFSDEASQTSPIPSSGTPERVSMRSSSVDLDPYAALRGLSISSTKQTSTHPKTVNERQRPQSYQYGSSDSFGSWHAPEPAKSSNLFGDFDPLVQFKK
ncbi:hypothetical protein CLU79DRAFT_715908 [Phycomyces nitens]|nr:hypothetical protein CLU79DRAFT_715908 [Phycomyces nitens]